MGWILLVLLGVAAAALLLILWIRLSPWPGSMFIRLMFERDSKATSERLEPRVPSGIEERLALQYDRDDAGALLDLFRPEADSADVTVAPVVVWIHGGAWISGRREDVANFLRILAGHGLVAVGVDYAIAPGSHYPRPLEQVGAALRFLSDGASELGIARDRFVLAGDSAGAQIAAQTAAMIADPAYSSRVGVEPGLAPEQLRAALLCCGAYELRLANAKGAEGWFMRTALSAYSGTRDYLSSESFRLADVIEHVGPGFPPTFITAGNADPLLGHSRAMAARLDELGVAVDSMFFDANHLPGLGHEYQFDLDREEARTALNRMVAFTRAHAGGAIACSAPAAPPA